MAYTPTKRIGKALNILRNTIAASATFRALTGTATFDEAYQRICFPDDSYAANPECDKQLLIPRPRAIVRLGQGFALRSIGVGQLAAIWPLVMNLEAAAPAAVDDEPIANTRDAQWLWWNDQWMAIVEEMIVVMRVGNDGDGHQTLSHDAEMTVIQGPDLQEAENDQTCADEEIFYVGLQWTVNAPGG
jgi:hypothetical protein